MNFSLISLSSSKMSSNSANISLSFDANKLESVIKLGYHQCFSCHFSKGEIGRLELAIDFDMRLLDSIMS